MDFIILVAAVGGTVLLLWMLLHQSEKKLRERNQSRYKSGHDVGLQVAINRERIEEACSVSVTHFHNAINLYSRIAALTSELNSKKKLENAESYLLGSIYILMLDIYEPRSATGVGDNLIIKVITDEEWIIICKTLASKVIADKPLLYGHNSNSEKVGLRLADRLRLRLFDEQLYNLGERHAKELIQFFNKRGPEPDYSEFSEAMKRLS